MVQVLRGTRVGPHLRAVDALCQLRIVASLADPDLLALQVRRSFQLARLVGANDQLRVGDDIRPAEVKDLAAFVGRCHLVDYHVVLACLQAGQDATPLGSGELRLHTELGSNSPANLDIEARQIALVVLEVERWVAAGAAGVYLALRDSAWCKYSGAPG